MTSTTFFFVFIPLLAIILLAVNLIFAPHNPYPEKDSAFECGFHSFLGQNRTQFSISFFIFALLFLLFDLEILLVYPYVVSAYTNGIYGLTVMLIFFLALTLGFAFELGKNALKIESRQMVTLKRNMSSTTTSISSTLGGLGNLKDISRLPSTGSLFARVLKTPSKRLDLSTLKNLRKSLSTTRSLLTENDQSSNDRLSEVPDLKNSRAVGKWDSSTIPDTESQKSSDSYDVNRYNRDIAERSKVFHDYKEVMQKESLDTTHYVKSDSGKILRDFTKEDIVKIAEVINKTDNKEKAQEIYDKYHDDINTIYAVVKESINTDKQIELRGLEAHNRKKTVDNLDLEKQKIISKYEELEKDNLSYNGFIKGELRYLVRDDLELRGADETSEDSVYVDELKLKSSKSDDEISSIKSTETHHPLDRISSNKNEKPLEGSSKIFESADSNKRSLENSTELESSRKRSRQDSSHVGSEAEENPDSSHVGSEGLEQNPDYSDRNNGSIDSQSSTQRDRVPQDSRDIVSDNTEMPPFWDEGD